MLEKNNITTYYAYNPEDNNKNIHFYNSLGKDLGYINVEAKSFSLSSKLTKDGKIEKLKKLFDKYKNILLKLFQE